MDSHASRHSPRIFCSVWTYGQPVPPTSFVLLRCHLMAARGSRLPALAPPLRPRSDDRRPQPNRRTLDRSWSQAASCLLPSRGTGDGHEIMTRYVLSPEALPPSPETGRDRASGPSRPICTAYQSSPTIISGTFAENTIEKTREKTQVWAVINAGLVAYETLALPPESPHEPGGCQDTAIFHLTALGKVATRESCGAQLPRQMSHPPPC
jgi:hypothetical protein